MNAPLLSNAVTQRSQDVAGPVKRSLTIAGHRTSISLEPVFWKALQGAAEAGGTSIAALVEAIDSDRKGAGLSSAIRVYLFERLSRLESKG